MQEKQKVLIVDDESRNQRIIVEILEDLVELKTVSSGEEAINALKDYTPDLILLDIMMPGMDGYEVCKKIKSDSKLILTKIIMVSGKAMLEERLKGYECGADDYMTKPFVSEELLAKAKVFLRLCRVEKQFAELNSSLEQQVNVRTEQLFSTEAKLVNSAKMAALGEMAGGIAHEINTPLGTIGLVAEQIQELVNEDNIDRKTVGEMTEIIAETVKRIGTIISGLKTFSRDGSTDRFESVSVKQIVGTSLSLCQEKFKHANIKIQINAIPDDLKIQCRTVQISQVLVNLLNNACDAVLPLEDRWIRISAEANSIGIKVSVTDSGSGIPENVNAKLFQPFFTTKDIGKGTGLGLSISKGIMDAHQGTMSLDGSCKNTSFVLQFPEHLTLGNKEVA